MKCMQLNSSISFRWLGFFIFRMAFSEGLPRVFFWLRHFFLHTVCFMYYHCDILRALYSTTNMTLTLNSVCHNICCMISSIAGPNFAGNPCFIVLLKSKWWINKKVINESFRKKILRSPHCPPCRFSWD